MTPELLSHRIQDFLAASRDAVVVENGAELFDLDNAKYSISGEHGKCLLHLWSAERNIVRRVLDAELKNRVLRLSVLRLGQTRPTKLDICRERDQRTSGAKKSARILYQSCLRRALESHFPDHRLIQLSSSMDLEHSFSPVYARGILRKGQTCSAVLGVNGEETQPLVAGALTFGILWLHACREANKGKCLVQGLDIFVPPGRSGLIRERIACLNTSAAQWRLFDFDQRENTIRQVDFSDRGNTATRLVHCVDEAAARERFAEPIARIHEVLPEASVAVLSAAELAFRLHGLELARARLGHQPGTFASAQEIVFGIGAEERVLDESSMSDFVSLIRSAAEVRHPDGPRDHPLFRLHPERWLESLVLTDVTCIDERLRNGCVYSQVPAFSASDRAMVDVLTTTRQNRLAIIELKAEEDIHLPLQGLDYWSRVNWHHRRGEFSKYGYFPGRELSPEPPLLFLLAPALHVHPATDTLLHYISPEINWTLVGIDERWRHTVRPVFRKCSPDRKAA